MATPDLAPRIRPSTGPDSQSDPDSELQPWAPKPGQPDGGHQQRQRRRWLHAAWLLTGAALLAAVAAWQWLGLLGAPLDASERSLLQAAMASAAACVLLLLVLVGSLWQRQRRMARALRLSAEKFRHGAWRLALDQLRQPEQRVPSAFGDLASGVEGMVGESERRWQARAELSSDWYWETDARGRLCTLSADAPWVQAAGRSLKDMLGRRFDQLGFMHAPEAGWEGLFERMDQHLGLREFELFVDGLGHRDSGWVALTARPRWGRDGLFAGYEGVGSDITARKQAYRRLLASEQRHAVMAGLSADWYWQTDAQHRCMPPDAELLRRFGDLARRMAGHTFWELNPAALAAEQWQAHREDLAAGLPFRALEFALQRDDGRTVWVSLAGAPRHAEDGQFAGYHGVGRDITLRKMTEQMLVQHNRELQSAVSARTRELELANRDLDRFAQQLAHELRTPIAQVQSLAELLGTRLGGRLQDDERRLLDLQRRATSDMLAALQALLELAQSSAASADSTDRQTVSISDMAAEVIAALAPLERDSTITWDIQPALQAWANAPQLRIVLFNLLGNAAKFTRRTAHARVSLHGECEASGMLRLRVTDNGVGFDESRAERLFEPFQRLHRQEDYAGTGIGLTIVQRIVQRHGGQIRARSSPGQGTCIEFTLERGGP